MKKVIVLLTAAMTLVGCRTVKVIEQFPVEIHDTTYLNKEIHDSTFIDRWHTEYVKGDTVYVKNNQITVKLRTVTDTTYKFVEKPVTVTVEQIKEVKKPLAWWQKGLMYCGCIALVAAALALAVRLRR
ncbi:MAG: hypothetical protein IKV77_05125 [Alistipes sp.]|nr:hypothetical protein [Bacteroidales bacterium]MBR5492494.1 hypothetical protein [Alistipes sp.]MBR5920055.1 hypothetical protein [Bacteroidales bacterium]